MLRLPLSEKFKDWLRSYKQYLRKADVHRSLYYIWRSAPKWGKWDSCRGILWCNIKSSFNCTVLLYRDTVGYFLLFWISYKNIHIHVYFINFLMSAKLRLHTGSRFSSNVSVNRLFYDGYGAFLWQQLFDQYIWADFFERCVISFSIPLDSSYRYKVARSFLTIRLIVPEYMIITVVRPLSFSVMFFTNITSIFACDYGLLKANNWVWVFFNMVLIHIPLKEIVPL